MTDENSTEVPGKSEEPKAPKKPRATTKSGSGKDWSYTDPSLAQVSRIQRALGLGGFYQGPANGKWDLKTRKAVAHSLAAAGYTVGENGGLRNQETVHAIQLYAKRFGSYVGPVDDSLTAVVWSAYEVGLRNHQNGN